MSSQRIFPVRSLLAAAFLVQACPGAAGAQSSAPVLSRLNGSAEAPVFTTYAAAPKRSEFTLDKGYHFAFADSNGGADFTNALGGDICVAFKKEGKYVYAIKDMARPPVVTASYPDMMAATMYPFPDVRVDLTFLVYSSHDAVLAVDMWNLAKTGITVEFLPFLRNGNRTFDSVAFGNDRATVTAVHEEFPDSWVLGHGVPYVDKVRDAFCLSEYADRSMSFRSYSWGPVNVPQEIDLAARPVFQVWGRMATADGGRCSAPRESSRLMAMINNDPSRLLTENAPRKGSAERNMTEYGYYGLELGNFPGLKEGDRYMIRMACGASSGEATAEGVAHPGVPVDSSRQDVVLGPASGPVSPEGVKMDIWGSGTEVRLYWKKRNAPMAYDVYRRDYRAGGEYVRIATGLSQAFFTDKNITGDKVYGYVVVAVDSSGARSMPSAEVNNIAGSDFLTDVRYPGQGTYRVSDLAKILAFSRRYDLRQGYRHRVMVCRSVSRMTTSAELLADTCRGLSTLSLPLFLADDEKLFAPIPPLRTGDSTWRMVDAGSFALMRQAMLPREARCGSNYYVFSREPQWGWGHGGQVFHESLTMLAYALMDPSGAMNSQRVYFERQKPDGYINYRTGPYLDEDIYENGELTTSAPWFAWQNAEINSIAHDKTFLAQAYRSSASFYRYYVGHRDKDRDGLCEWGGEAVLESVRDGLVAVWDQVGYPSQFEALDLNTMLVVEARSLASMARELGRKSEADAWEADAAKRSGAINELMWDGVTGFYYNVDRAGHSFTHKSRDDLKRQEIIGFLPLWAGIASKEQAAKLVAVLTDSAKFWRKFGIPSLAADDRYYNPKGYWNGPVWIPWNYLILRGLLNYGYVREARELTERVVAGIAAGLRKDHVFWEFYSPDTAWGGYHKTYLWDGLVSRMMRDVEAAEAQRK
jgi:hypothetical protein